MKATGNRSSITREKEQCSQWSADANRFCWSRLSVLTAQSGLMMMASLLSAHADEAAETSSASATAVQAEDNGETLVEIVVTARRRGEVLQDVPVAVTAVTPSE